MPTLHLPNESRRPFFLGTDGIWTAVKDIDSVIPYLIDWSEIVIGDEITGSAWEIEVPGISMVGDSFDATTTTIAIAGTNGIAKNTITTILAYTYVKRFAFIDESQVPIDYRRY